MAGYDIKQSLKFTQQLLMTPQLQQAIKLLQLSRLELEDFISQQIAENPVLEEGVEESREERLLQEKERERTEVEAVNEHMNEAQGIVDANQPDRSEDFDWENYSQKGDLGPLGQKTASGNEEGPNYENMVKSLSTLNDYLLGQLGELDLDEEEKTLALHLVGNIDERGYLVSQIDDIAEELEFELEFVEDILDVIQRLDPPGVGARNLQECLLIQLKALGIKDQVLEKLIKFHLSEIEDRNIPKIAKALGLSQEELLKKIQILAELEPNPGRPFGEKDVQYVVPDVYVFKIADQWVIAMNDEGLPKLKVSRMYQDMLERKEAKGKDKEYLSDKIKSADWLIRSIHQRQKTIYKVAFQIVERQKAFFEQGVEFLKPLKLKDIAFDTDLHESTVSRVTTHKYMHTPRGIFELKYFFSSKVSDENGEGVASEAVRKMVQDLIKQEDQKNPLSDQRLVELLAEKNVNVARRTIAKYREQLGINPSSKRKKTF